MSVPAALTPFALAPRAAEAAGLAATSGYAFGTSDVISIAAVLVLLLVSAFLAASETALTRMSRIRAGALEDEGRRRAGTLRRLVEHPDRWLHPVLFLLLVCHLAIGFLVPKLLEEPFGQWGVLIGLVAEAVVVFVCSELIPKDYAVKHTDRVALGVAPVVAVLIALPPVRLMARLLLGIASSLVKGHVDAAPATSEQELLAMADAALDEDVIERDERSMIHSVIEFGDTVVREVMVPRPDMITVDAGSTVDEATLIAIAAGYSRIPLINESKDDIAGVVYAKDLMRALREGKSGEPVAALARPARYAPESKRVSDLMREMQTQKFHLAVVLDEYGGTAGIVTLEDLIEELVGEIVDEFDIEEAQVEHLPNGDVRVTSRMLIGELNTLLGVDWPDADWDSVGGLLLNRLGHPASEGETADYAGFRLRAERVKGRRVGRVRISRLHDDEHADEAG